MRRISFCFTVVMMVVVLLLTMSAAPVLANDRGDRGDRNDRGERHDDRDNFTFFRTPFLAFDEDEDNFGFDFDENDNDNERDVDEFNVGGVPCFAVSDGTPDVFCLVNNRFVRIT